MVRMVEMLCRVTFVRIVTTADVTARETEPKMNPLRAEFQALFTALWSGRESEQAPASDDGA